MTDPATDPGDELVLFAEPGSTWRPLLAGPLLAAVGIGLESFAPGGADVVLWLGVGLLVLLFTLILVRSRRRFLRVEVTATRLTQGTRVLPLSQVSGVRPEDDSPFGVRVLGDGPVVPRKFGYAVLRLTDGARVVAWARDGAGLRRALVTATSARRTTP